MSYDKFLLVCCDNEKMNESGCEKEKEKKCKRNQFSYNLISCVWFERK